MGSTLSSLRSLLENQLDSGETDASTDPTSTLLNTYINSAIRTVVRKDRPHELYSAAVSTASISSGTNTASIPTSIFVPDLVYYSRSSGSVVELIQKPIKEMIDRESPFRFFDTGNTGDPSMYDVRGTSFLFNKYFDRTDATAIKVYGIGFPTTLVNDSDTTELPIDYDLLVVYESAVLFYQKDDDLENQRKYQILASERRADIRVFLRTNDSSSIEMDPYVFTGDYGSRKSNPSIFFGG